MATVAEFVLEELVPQLGLPPLVHKPRYPANYGHALRLFEALVRADADGKRVYGPHTGGRLVLKQVEPSVRPVRCRNCGDPIWRDGIEPGRGIWLHRHRYDETAARLGVRSWAAVQCTGRRGTASPRVQLVDQRPGGAR